MQEAVFLHTSLVLDNEVLSCRIGPIGTAPGPEGSNAHCRTQCLQGSETEEGTRSLLCEWPSIAWHATRTFIMNIRKATREDAEQISWLVRQTIQQVNAKDYKQEQISAWISTNTPDVWKERLQNQDRLVYVAEEDGIVGIAMLNIDEAEIGALYIDSHCIGKGIGKILLHTLEEYARSHGFPQLHTYATLTSISFYQSQGYVKVQEKDVAINGVLVHVVLMQKYL